MVADTTKNQFQLPKESARSIQVEMVYSPDGGNATTESVYTGLSWGSSFLYELDRQVYIVTARHNVTGKHWQTGEWLTSRSSAPTHLKVAFLPKPPTQGWQIRQSQDNPRLGEMRMRMPMYSIPLIVGEIGDEKPLWKEHPELGSDMDVAVLPFVDNRGDALITSWKPPVNEPAPDGMIWPPLSAGQDIFIIGHPLGMASGPLLPLWMRGTIASEPSMGHNVGGETLPLMVIDARTRSGSSGSVVIRHRPDGTLIKKADETYGVTVGSHSEILGVYSGRTHSDSDLGYVWRIDEVDEVCRRGVPGST